MKTKVLFVPVLLLAIFAISSPADAQTKQQELVANFGEMYIPCVDCTIDGTWTAHFTYFLGKDGKIARMHVNTSKSEFYDINSGEEVKILDTFNDNYGNYFWLMNNPNAANGVQPGDPNVYNVDDGWLDEYMPENYPFEEGTMVEMNWKFLMKGKKFGFSTLIQIHRNANGELTAEVIKTKAICSE